jgi:hypothetical protein
VSQNGIVYYISFDDSNNVERIFTYDTNFVSPDNLKVGDSYLTAQTETDGYYWNFQHSICLLNSGWVAVFYSDSSFNDSSKISWFERGIIN